MKQVLLFLLLVFPFIVSAQNQKTGVIDKQAILNSIPSRQQSAWSLELIQKSLEARMEYTDSLVDNLKNIDDPTLEQQTERLLLEKSLESDSILSANYGNKFNDHYDKLLNQAIEIVMKRKRLTEIVDLRGRSFSNETVDVNEDVLKEILKLDAKAPKLF